MMTIMMLIGICLLPLHICHLCDHEREGCISGWHTQGRRDSAKDIAFSHDNLQNIDDSITPFKYAINGWDRELWQYNYAEC